MGGRKCQGDTTAALVTGDEWERIEAESLHMYSYDVNCKVGHGKPNPVCHGTEAHKILTLGSSCSAS